MTKHKAMGCLLPLGVLLAFATTVSAADQNPALKPDAASVRKLVAQLQSDDFDTREQATQKLSKLEEVPDALRAALKSDDLEVRRRARAAIATIEARLEDKAFKAMVADLHKVEVDRFVRRMVEDRDFAGDKQWAIVQMLTKAVTAKANDLGGKKFKVADLDMKSLPQQRGLAPNQLIANGKRLLLNNQQRVACVNRCVFLCAGATPKMNSLSNSIVIVDGDFTGCISLNNCVLIVRGNVGHITSVRNSIILATGESQGATVCTDSFYQVSNKQLRFTQSKDNVYVKSTAEWANRDTNGRVLDTKRGPLQLLKFSDKKESTTPREKKK